MFTITKEVSKRIKGEEYYSEEQFEKDCKTYVKAVQSGRIQYTVTHVSQSGMSRNIMITSYEGTMQKGYYRSYYLMLKALGYSFVKGAHEIKVGGCGMDMLFATNYAIIHDLKRMKLISKAKCDKLAQMV